MQALLLTEGKNKVIQKLLEESPQITFDGECLSIHVGNEVELSISKTQIFVKGWPEKRDLTSPFTYFIQGKDYLRLNTQNHDKFLLLKKRGALYFIAYQYGRLDGVDIGDLFQSSASALAAAAAAWEVEIPEYARLLPELLASNPF